MSERVGIQITAAALGEEHPISQHVAVLAERNMSVATKKAIVERHRAIQAEIAQQILKQEMPSREAMAEARAQDNEAMTPVVERLWALRNVASTLALGGEGERRMAKTYLEKALQLQRDYLAIELHPGLVGELWRSVLLNSLVFWLGMP